METIYYGRCWDTSRNVQRHGYTHCLGTIIQVRAHAARKAKKKMFQRDDKSVMSCISRGWYEMNNAKGS